ncbi:hypothetical protein ABZ027_34240 [Streptomyces sp. NPDC006332]|uniref:hypothetical protein n=1 Tax=Streptomyces sp. NPDC006332 TaxID=3155456 RepID=UPI0033A42E9B
MHSRGRTLKFTAVLAMVVLALTGFSTGRHGRGHSSSGSDGGGCSSSSQNHGSSSSTSGGSSGSYGSDDDSTYDSSTSGDSYGSSTSGGSGSGSGYNRRPGYRSTPTSSSTGSGTALKDGTAKLVSCATATTPYATVEITNPNKREADFQAWVTFYDAEGTELLKNISVTVTVPAKGRANTKVKLGDQLLGSVDHCQVDPEAELAN